MLSLCIFLNFWEDIKQECDFISFQESVFRILCVQNFINQFSQNPVSGRDIKIPVMLKKIFAARNKGRTLLKKETITFKFFLETFDSSRASFQSSSSYWKNLLQVCLFLQLFHHMYHMQIAIFCYLSLE